LYGRQSLATPLPGIESFPRPSFTVCGVSGNACMFNLQLKL